MCLASGASGTSLLILIASTLQLLLPDWEIGFSLVALLTAFLYSTVAGASFDWLPARNAARLDPVGALIQEQCHRDKDTSRKGRRLDCGMCTMR